MKYMEVANNYETFYHSTKLEQESTFWNLIVWGEIRSLAKMAIVA